MLQFRLLDICNIYENHFLSLKQQQFICSKICVIPYRIYDLSHNTLFASHQFILDKRASDGIQASPQTMNTIVAPGSHARSTSYSVSYCTKKAINLPIENKGKYLNFSANLHAKNNSFF